MRKTIITCDLCGEKIWTPSAANKIVEAGSGATPPTGKSIHATMTDVDSVMWPYDIDVHDACLNRLFAAADKEDKV